MDPDGQLRNLRDFLLVYNRMTEICFQRCTTNFNYRNLTMDEEHCVDSCAGKLIRSNHRLMGTYVKLMPAMVQRRMEEMESKAAETAKAAEVAAPVEPLAGGSGTPETTTMVSSSTAEHVGSTEALAGSVSFTPSTSEPTLINLSPAPAPAVPLMSESVIQAADSAISSVTSQATNVSLVPPLVTEHAQSTAAELPAVVSSTQGSSSVNSSLPAQGSLSSVVAAIPIEKLALKQVSVDNSSTSPVPGLQSTAGTKQDKTS
ncbi:mitochondrial import inner membrane translocase subunit Tim10 B [Colossoma macropomum]|uniref:mitochondrial import inner membrane translocase subunit Tim10 B n=1 Tax=Colossoma macropomum TaxID=42526 RepID=UPI001863F893|nr:mitochondrial import inner membrane translocase subunit Tim10 B [Colossoma macropomum]